MASTCANKSCGVVVVPADRSKDGPRFCSECGDLVYAFRPDREASDDWFLVSDGSEPDVLSHRLGGQCEVCYLSEYQIEQDSKNSWSAVCAGQVADGTWVEGCRTRHPVRMKPRHLVVL